jgi:hypothetical protein
LPYVGIVRIHPLCLLDGRHKKIFEYISLFFKCLPSIFRFTRVIRKFLDPGHYRRGVNYFWTQGMMTFSKKIRRGVEEVIVCSIRSSNAIKNPAINIIVQDQFTQFPQLMRIESNIIKIPI